MEQTETEIQRQICEYLEWGGHFFTRVNTIPVYDKGRDRYRKMPKYTLRGFPDIIVFHKGESVCLEVKRPKGRLSREQKEFQARCAENGIKYHVVTDYLEVKKLGL